MKLDRNPSHLLRHSFPSLPRPCPSLSPPPAAMGRTCFSGRDGSCAMEYAARTSQHEATCRLREGIDSVLSRWHGLRLAVDNKWGGRDSARKYAGLVDDIFSWFYHSGGGISVEELESYLHESMLLTFNTEVEDGSIEDVAEQLMLLLHEEYGGSY